MIIPVIQAKVANKLLIQRISISLYFNTKFPFLPDMNSVSALPCLFCEVEFTIYLKKVIVTRIICNKILKLCF